MLSGSATLAVQYIPGEPDYGTPFYVEDYGAVGDGSTDDGPAIQRAYNAAWNFNKVGAASAGAPACVFFQPNTDYRVLTKTLLNPIRTNDWYTTKMDGSSDPCTPTVANAGTITFYGKDATISYAPESTARICWLEAKDWATIQYQTYGNIIIDGFTIENNWRAPSADTASILRIIGSANVSNITIRNVSTTDKLLSRTTYNQKRTCAGIAIHVYYDSRTQLHTTYCSDVTVEDCTIYGQNKPVGIYCEGDGGEGYWAKNPVIYDNIEIYRTYTNNLHHCGSGIHLGSYGSGYRCKVIDCTCVDSDDDLIEINAFNEIEVSGCHFEGSYDDLMLTWFSYPYYDTTPNITVTNCTYSGTCEPYWPHNDPAYTTEPATRSPMVVCLVGLSITGSGSYTDLQGRSWGNYTVTGCTPVEFGVDNAYASHQSTFKFIAPMSGLSLTDCDITDVGTGGYLVEVQQRPAGGHIDVTIRDVRWRSSTSAGYSLLPESKVYRRLDGDVTYDTDIVGLV